MVYSILALVLLYTVYILYIPAKVYGYGPVSPISQYTGMGRSCQGHTNHAVCLDNDRSVCYTVEDEIGLHNIIRALNISYIL